ncbi:MAG TPA: hypothetical protein VI953_04645 [Candidatus Paceibacterota bacterium]
MTRDYETERREKQTAVDAAALRLANINFKNYVEVIEWLEEIQEPSDFVGVRLPEDLLETFRAHGLNPRTSEEGPDLSHDRRHAKWVIEEALSHIKLLGAIHPRWGRFVTELRQYEHPGERS